MKITTENIEYRECLSNLIRTGKDEELSKKIKAFINEGKGFEITKIRRLDYSKVINRDRRFWQDLGFKEINIKSTKTSKKANNLISITRKRKGKVYYNSLSKGKLAFLIPTKERKLDGIGRMKFTVEKYYYTIIIL